MNAYETFAYRWLHVLSEKQAAASPDVQKRLSRAHIPMRAGAWLATLYLNSLLAGLGGLLLGILLTRNASGIFAPLKVMVPLVFGAFLGIIVFSLGPLLLQNTANNRAKEMDENLPHAMNYMLALANAGLPPKEIWGSLAKAEIFGPIAYEADRITRDLDLFGYDILKALRLAQERTPSKLFHEFLQGAISAFQSGVELESYLKTKGEQYTRKSEEEQLKALDTMGVMAEAFLVTVVAAPLFLIILLTVMAINQGRDVIFYGFVLVLVFIPMAQTIIGALIRSMTPKVWT